MGIFDGGLNGDGFFGEEYRDDWEQGEWSSGYGRRRSVRHFIITVNLDQSSVEFVDLRI